MEISKDSVTISKRDLKRLKEIIQALRVKSIKLSDRVIDKECLWLRFVEQCCVMGSSQPISKLKRNQDQYPKFIKAISFDVLSQNENQVQYLQDTLKNYKATRFYNKQAKRIASNIENWDKILNQLNNEKDPVILRDSLMGLFSGLKMKSISDYLTTTGYATEFIAFDSRIERFFIENFGINKKQTGYIHRYPKVYRLLEQELTAVLSQSNVTLGQLDRALYAAIGSDIPKAFAYAYQKHLGYPRKNKTVPYLVHPMDVASILMKNDAPEHLIIAGILHDIVEDTPVLIDEIEDKFGKKVAVLVDGATEPMEMRAPELRKHNWPQRKQHTIDLIKNADYELKLLSCADKLSNIRDTINDLRYLGKEISNYEDNKRYYSAMLESFSTSTELQQTGAYKEFKQTVETIYT
jgi:thermostable 8-oxoguanine DNA glycosylase